MKKKIVLRIFSALLCASLIFAISGCGKKTTISEIVVGEDEDSSNSGASASETQSGSTPVKKNPSKKNNNTKISMMDVGTKGANGKDYSNYNPYSGIEKFKGTTVKFATWIDHSQDDMATGIENFEKKYSIKIETVYCTQNNYIQEVMALIQAGKAPDIVVENGFFPGTVQIAQPIENSGIDTNEPFWDQDVIKALSVNGKNYFVNSVNSYVQPFGICVFNKDLLQSNGIKTPAEYYKEGKWTFENMKKIMQQVSALGADYGGGDVATGGQVLGAAGATCATYDGAKFTNTLTSTSMVDALKFVRQLDQEKLNVDQKKFIEGKAGLLLTDTYSLKQSGYLRAMDGDLLGYTYLPVAKQGAKEYVSNFFLRGYGIAKSATNAKAAGYFLRYILDSDNIDLLGDAFWNIEAAQFFYDAVKHNKGLTKCNDYGYGIAEYSGTWWAYWTQGSDDPNQVSVVLQSHYDEAQKCIDKANKLLAGIR